MVLPVKRYRDVDRRFFGRQSGLPQFKVADITEDYRILEVARLEAIERYEKKSLK